MEYWLQIYNDICRKESLFWAILCRLSLHEWKDIKNRKPRRLKLCEEYRKVLFFKSGHYIQKWCKFCIIKNSVGLKTNMVQRQKIWPWRQHLKPQTLHCSNSTLMKFFSTLQLNAMWLLCWKYFNWIWGLIYRNLPLFKSLINHYHNHYKRHSYQMPFWNDRPASICFHSNLS